MEELLEQLARIAELTDAELTALEASLRQELEARGASDLTDDVIAEMQQLADGIETVRTEATTRETVANERRTKAEEILNRVKTPEPVDETTEEDVPDTEEEDPATDDAGEAAPQPGEPQAEEVEKPEAVAAAADEKSEPAPKRPKISDIAARRPKTTPRVMPPRAPVAITAAADVPGFSAGSRMKSLEDVAKALIARRGALRNVASGVEEQVSVATFSTQYPSDRVLGPNAEENDRRIQSALAPEALTASGGLCAPLAPVYTLANISQAARPVRDSLAQFQATRGGIRYISPPVITDVAGAVGTWTATTDASPGNNTKNCLHVTCGSELTAVIEAVTRCLKFGNLGARAFPEQVTTWIELAMANWARLAERKLIDSIDAASTQVTTGLALGTTRDVLAVIDRAVAQYRNRHRTAPELRLRLMIPEWLDDNMRTDLAREMPGAYAERLATADAELDSFYAVRGVTVTRMLEGKTGSGQDFAAQGAGALLGWPSTVIMYLFHEGAHLFLDAGTLDLGIVRDSTLNQTNDYEIFAESFEGTAKLGIESLAITATICASGTASGLTAFNPCTIGS